MRRVAFLTPYCFRSISVLHSLRSLTLLRTYDVTDESLSLLTNLNTLDLSFTCGISDRSISKLTNLTSLRLYRSAAYGYHSTLQVLIGRVSQRITDQSVSLLVNLKSLDIKENIVFTNEAVRNLHKLQHLNLSHGKNSTLLVTIC